MVPPRSVDVTTANTVHNMIELSTGSGTNIDDMIPKRHTVDMGPSTSYVPNENMTALENPHNKSSADKSEPNGGTTAENTAV